MIDFSYLPIPSQEEWGDIFYDFDVQDVHKSFFGKNHGQAIALFKKDVLSRSQDVRFMPEKVFPYYMMSFGGFVQGGEYGENSSCDVANCYIDVIESKLNQVKRVSPLVENVSLVLRFIRDDIGKFIDGFGVRGSK
ncbi:hypothetical protein [Chitiniphilus eburneus]|uniref:Uncharacterized protein n=1 Tax=Chitiniphilus eburneus TaxID=2571148 RepID=A0A4U0QA94_9NEIS|nr:hypothetical protein [Chitiniphilus eburneus]TJZ77322.1 hypothetical protein FAZ21_02975 [Chitiniphilus eburneus]